jgi:hypothetical protein
MSSSPSSRNSTQSDELPQATRIDVIRASRRLAGAKLRVSIAEKTREYLPTLQGRSTVEQELIDTVCGAALDQLNAEVTGAQDYLNMFAREYDMDRVQNTHFDIDPTDNTVADDAERDGSEAISVPEDNTVEAQYLRVSETFRELEKEVREDFVSESSAHGEPATHDPAELNEAFAKVYDEVATFLQAELSRVKL